VIDYILKTNDMNQFKRAQVIMLPTENILENGLQPYSVYAKPITKRGWLLPKSGAEARRLYQNGNQAYHLYIISDDEIKEGDWCIMFNDFGDKYIVKILNLKTIGSNDIEVQLLNGNKNCCDITKVKKIIATTDSSLIINDWMKTKENNIEGKYESSNYLPQPSQQFIEKYTESYNKGEIITDVLVEYEQKDFKWVGNKNLASYSLKVNPKDNTITIKKVKDSWNREDVYKIIRKAITDTNKAGFRNISMDYNKWIEENL